MPLIERMLVMVQAEVGQRLAAGPGSKAYGAVSVKVAYWAEASVVGRVPPSVFLPRPKVDSALVAIRRRDVPAGPAGVPPEALFTLVRAGFSQRRKTLRRSLAGLVDEADFAAAGVDPGARAEQLDVAAWGRLVGRGAEALPVVSSVRAPAKLTLTLRITSVRGDRYHELDAEMVSLSLADTLTFSDGDGLTVGGPHCGGVPMDDSNLVRRALALIGRTASVHVEKQIPSGAGLGGGSADAAAVLRWAGVDDLVVAARLGADVPFCLVGGRARVRGIGDRVTPLAFVDRSFTLITPPLSVSTADVYRAWDDLGGPSGRGRNDLERGRPGRRSGAGGLAPTHPLARGRRPGSGR